MAWFVLLYVFVGIAASAADATLAGFDRREGRVVVLVLWPLYLLHHGGILVADVAMWSGVMAARAWMRLSAYLRRWETKP